MNYPAIGYRQRQQIILYNKRREVLQTGKTWWFDHWLAAAQKNGTGETSVIRCIDDLRGQRSHKADIWRLEVRAGKRHLKDRHGLSSIEDIDRSFGALVQDALTKVHLLDGDAWYDTANVTRAPLHPLWRAATENARFSIRNQSTGIDPVSLESRTSSLSILQ